MSRLLVVILNFRTAGLAIDCLEALAPQVEALPGSRVVVTDNDSADGSAERIARAIEDRHWGRWAECVALPRNGGYAYGNNAAIRPALLGPDPPEYVLLLNPDTVPRAGALRELIAFLDSRPEVGIAGSRLEYEDGTQHDSRFRFPSILTELDTGLRLGVVTRLVGRHTLPPPLGTESHPIDWVAGASMMVRRKVFEDIGLLDEGYFLYFEETDFCLRARRAGWASWYVPASRVAHLVGRSTGVTSLREPARRRPRYWFESRRRYFVKNHGRLYAWVADLTWAACFGLWQIRSRVQRKPDHGPPRLWSDFVRFNFLERPG
ncbi:MAG: glycosyltransferase family 2 protein [Planctomycetes bacterium]|nr:glycosyltransferase family 2 protein [Planctomycetota bacterium]